MAGKYKIVIEYAYDARRYLSQEPYHLQQFQSVKDYKQKKKRALINITADQKAKAIGKDGINIRLASMLYPVTALS